MQPVFIELRQKVLALPCITYQTYIQSLLRVPKYYASKSHTSMQVLIMPATKNAMKNLLWISKLLEGNGPWGLQTYVFVCFVVCPQVFIFWPTSLVKNIFMQNSYPKCIWTVDNFFKWLSEKLLSSEHNTPCRILSEKILHLRHTIQHKVGCIPCSFTFDCCSAFFCDVKFLR